METFGIVEFIPKIKIYLIDKSEIIINQKHENIIIEAWKKQAVITLGSVTINGNQITKIEPLDITENYSYEIPGPFQKTIHARAKVYQNNTGRYPSDTKLKEWCDKLKKGLKID